MTLKVLITAVVAFGYTAIAAQNVGVGTLTPTEKLDVNGNVNLGGQLKVNGNAGTAYQVLMKDGTNSLAWGDMETYKNFVVFDCFNLATSAGTSNCTPSWSVPAGVTTVFVQCWGGGGGGSNMTGGGSGGYIAAKIPVNNSSSVSLVVGAGGFSSSWDGGTTNGITGGSTSFTFAGVTITAGGGQGGKLANPFTTAGTITPGAAGGSYSVSGLSNQYYPLLGSPGGISKMEFKHVSTTEVGKFVTFGNGADAPLQPGSGGRGGYSMLSTVLNQHTVASEYGVLQGSGGGADNSFGRPGRGGRIIIHW